MDSAVPVDIENISPENVKTLQEFLSYYSRVTEMCFKDCVNDFTSRELNKHEEKCGMQCVEKFLKVNQRISARFQEMQMLASENLVKKN